MYAETIYFYMVDIAYYLSGGSFNTETSKSLGGLPSNVLISDTIGNLFSQVTSTQIKNGSSIYRCFYVFNESSFTLENTRIWLDSAATLSQTSVGVGIATEVQQITILGDVVGGTFTLQYTGNVSGIPVMQTTQAITFTPNATQMSQNIQSALNNLTLLGQVTVSATFDGAWQYFITFGGIHDHRYHNVLVVASNNLLGFGTLSMQVSIVTPGDPINATAEDVGFENQSPTGVEFVSDSSDNNPIVIGTLDPLDGFAVWLLRTTQASLDPGESDVDSLVFNLAAQADE
jgi:hypothetical protein